MAQKISNFILACKYLEKLSQYKKVPFFDLDIIFSSDHYGLHNNCLYIGESLSLGNTIYKIIYFYINDFVKITGKNIFRNTKDKIDNLIYLASLLRLICYGEDFERNSKPDGNLRTKLYDNVLLWIILNDIVSPLFNVEIQNLCVLKGSQFNIDIAMGVGSDRAEKVTNGKIKEPFIFENLDIENQSVRFASLLIEAIKLHGLNEYEVIRKITSDSNLANLLGISSLYFRDDDKANYFVLNLLQFLDLDYKNKFKTKIKMAQSGIGIIDSAYPPLQTWNVELIESLLEPMRSPDIYTYDELESKAREFWEKVEKVKRDKYNDEDIPFEVLLRIKSEDLKTDSSKTIQSLLSSARVW